MRRKIKFSLLFVLCVALIGTMLLLGINTLKAEATGREIVASGTIGDVNWTFYNDGELYIHGEGPMADLNGYSAQPWSLYRNNINKINISEGVTSVGDRCFSVTAVRSAYIPSSVTSIGSAAFNGCTYLENIDISYGVNSIGSSAFTSCSSLKSISLPDSITDIGMYCFEYCKSLETAVISNNLSRLRDRMFSDCTNLKTVTFSKNTNSISASVFSRCLNLENVYYSGTLNNWCTINFSSETSNPLAYADNLYLNGKLASANLVIPNTCTSIRSNAFYGASFIESVELPSSVAVIGNRSFGACANLKSITLSENLKTIDWYAFENCGSLEEITLPKTVAEIKPQAFNNCTNLTAINVDGENKIFSSDSDGVLFNKNKTLLIQYPIGKKITEYAVPDTVETINSYAFYNCVNLSRIILPESVKRIEEYAFCGCTALNKISATDSVEHIGIYEFKNTGYFNDKANWDNGFLYLGTLLIGADKDKIAEDCRLYSKTTLVASDVFKGFNIKSIYLNNNLKHINDNAFSQCSKITNITLPESMLTVGRGAFSGCSNIENISLNYGLSEIHEEAFAYLKKVTEIYIPQTVTLLSATAFKSSGITDIHYNDSKAEWKRLANGADFDGITIHYTIRSEDESVIIHHTDNNFNWEAGNVHLVVEDLGDATSSYEQNGFYNRLMVDPIQVLDIKLVDGDGENIQPLSDETITVKIKASEEFMKLMKSGLSAVSEYDVDAENIDFKNDCFVFDVKGETVSIPANEGFLKKFKIIHWYSDATQPTDHESFTHDEISVENGYIVLETNHFSEYAVCTEYTPKNDYTIKWIVDGVETEQIVTEEEIIAKPENPAKEGYTFIGWTPEVPDTMPAENLEFSALWQVNEYTITFDTAGGTAIAPIIIEYGAAITPPANPVKDGHTFIGWTPELPETMPAGDLTVVAEYEKIETPEVPEVTVTGIKIISLPNKTQYIYKVDSLDLSGLVVKIIYSDGTSKIISDTKTVAAYGFNVDSVGTKTITVACGEYTDEFEITVSYAWWQWIIRILLLGFIWY